MPKNCHPKLTELLERCWQQDPAMRPDFAEIIPILQQISKEVNLLFHDNRIDVGFISLSTGKYLRHHVKVFFFCSFVGLIGTIYILQFGIGLID